jgi:hypothetical protein
MPCISVGTPFRGPFRIWIEIILVNGEPAFAGANLSHPAKCIDSPQGVTSEPSRKQAHSLSLQFIQTARY